ncbi:type IV pilin protein [Undibacterium sp. RuRC25W]|uniref:type IV pilin protein n=1 Tax=Undibacterium sp. RuRC25W TaxID=3413047 RepID=UPI003BF25A77
MHKKRYTGFNLIELMITIAIIAILSTIAYASYSSSITRAKRVEGKSALFKAMQQEERFFTQHNRYIVFGKITSDPNASSFQWYSGDSATKSGYELSAAPCKDSAIQHCVEIMATPGTQNVDSHFQDSECEKFSLTSTGIKSFSGNGNKEQCW